MQNKNDIILTETQVSMICIETEIHAQEALAMKVGSFLLKMLGKKDGLARLVPRSSVEDEAGDMDILNASEIQELIDILHAVASKKDKADKKRPARLQALADKLGAAMQLDSNEFVLLAIPESIAPEDDEDTSTRRMRARDHNGFPRHFESLVELSRFAHHIGVVEARLQKRELTPEITQTIWEEFRSEHTVSEEIQDAAQTLFQDRVIAGYEAIAKKP